MKRMYDYQEPLIIKDFIPQDLVQAAVQHSETHKDDPLNLVVTGVDGLKTRGEMRDDEEITQCTVMTDCAALEEISRRVLSFATDGVEDINLNFKGGNLLRVSRMEPGMEFPTHFDDDEVMNEDKSREMIRMNVMLKPSPSGGAFFIEKGLGVKHHYHVEPGDLVLFEASHTPHGVTKVKGSARVIALFFVIGEQNDFEKISNAIKEKLNEN